MIMIATVLRINPQSLLVRNEENGEEVVVFFHNTNRFSAGERIRITYSGQMTLSIPPQITATSIERLGPVPSGPSEMRAVVIQRGNNFLMVRNTRNGQQVRVEYQFAHHFCVWQQVIVRYDTIMISNPPRVTATDIIPVC